VIVPLAWFAGYWSSEGSKIDFTTSGNSALGDMWVWMYKSPFEVSGSETPHWIKSEASKADDNSGFIIQPYLENTGEGDQFVLQSLHFGKIDNLTSLNPDNRLYFCFKLNDLTHGYRKVSFYFDYATYDRPAGLVNTETVTYPDRDPRYSIKIYDMNGQSINHFGGNGLTYSESNKALMELLEFTYCISTTPPPTAATIEGNDPFGGSLTFKSPTAITNSLADQDTGLDEGVGDYYLYICFSPKLENYGLHDHILDFFAQSYMLFDIAFSFEVHD
jgi:hypothetical protein